MKDILILGIVVLTALSSCKDTSHKKPTVNQPMDMKMEEASFGNDLEFLRKWDEKLIILSEGQARLVVSPKYQAKVFTSTASAEQGKSLGWINYKAFGKSDPHMNAFGGENRFWLGPEGNKFSIFFKPGTEMTFKNWRTPGPIDNESWSVARALDTAATLTKEMRLTNYGGNELRIEAERTIKILNKQEAETMLQLEIEGLQFVGFRTSNSITNTGDAAWTKETGAPCIWILDMFPPSDSTVVMIPYRKDLKGEVATTDYFGEIPADRIKLKDGLLLFKADGKARGKLGLSPARAKNIAGSYDAINRILTVALFDVDPGAVYLNQEWNTEADPFKGDAINAYNDGPLEDGSQMGPFYEIESVSPAAFLQVGETLTHEHSVFHFSGDAKSLNRLTKILFGKELHEITQMLKSAH